MLQPIHELLWAVDARLPGALVSPEAKARIGQVAARLPAAFCQICLECRLEPGVDRVDLLICSAQGEYGQDALRASFASGADVGPLGSSRAFVEEWVEPGTLLQREVPVMWLEYDLLPGGGEPDPFAFMCLDRSYMRGNAVGSSPGSQIASSHIRGVAERGLGLLLGGPPEPAALDTLDRCIGSLPPAGYLSALSVMPQRGRRDLRVSVAVPHGEVIPWLRAINWPGNEEGVELALDILGSGCARPAVHFDVGESVRPTIAFDFYLRTRPSETPSWARALDRLVEGGTCDRDRGQAALDWIGDETVDLPGAEWLVNIDRQLFFKLLPRLDGSIEAKAYLCIQHRYALF